MRILSIIAQKPYATGSGVYLVETIKAFGKMGHENAVVYGKYNDDNIYLCENVKEYPLIFDTSDLPCLIFGMSDEMPYKSMRYMDMDEKIFDLWSKNFISIIDKAINEFKPDVIIAHHLYLLTSIVRERYKNIRIVGICHNTDIRQYIKNNFKREFIKNNINLLDKICTLTSYHKELVIDTFGVRNEKIEIIGIGYNDKIFNIKRNLKKSDKINRFLYVGKIAKKKGVLALLKAIGIIEKNNDTFNSSVFSKVKTENFGNYHTKHLDNRFFKGANNNTDYIEFNFVGSAGNENEYNEIISYAKNLKIKINFLGKKNQIELADIYNENNIFVMPSYCEGIPMTVIEALACGEKVLLSNLPGVKEYLDENVINANVVYVDLPKLTNADDVSVDEENKYVERLSKGILEILQNNQKLEADVSKISWDNVAKMIIGNK